MRGGLPLGTVAVAEVFGKAKAYRARSEGEKVVGGFYSACWKKNMSTDEILQSKLTRALWAAGSPKLTDQAMAIIWNVLDRVSADPSLLEPTLGNARSELLGLSQAMVLGIKGQLLTWRIGEMDEDTADRLVAALRSVLSE